ncbi:MAG: ABC transporter ATP-binding protein [Lachnospiraceae bacterium]
MKRDIISFQDVSFSYHDLTGETKTLHQLNFSIKEGEFVSIVGPSGCGKSTLLSLIARIHTPSKGQIHFMNDTSDPNIGYMLQMDHLFAWRSIWSNCLLGLEIQGKLTKETIAYVEYLLKEYGLYDVKDKKPNELSGGMRQRVALIRTLVLHPDLLLLDEPFSALDFQTRLEVSSDIVSIIKKHKKTAILITHDLSEAISLSDRILVFSKRPATLLDDIDISLTKMDHTVLAARNAPEFNNYFNLLWNELDFKEVTSNEA